jgi:hypothetical protein
LLFEKRSLLNAVFAAGAETLLSFSKERGFLPAITGVLHTFGSDLKRHVHTHFILSAGGLKLDGKAERFTRFQQRQQRNPKATPRKVRVLTENPQWVSHSLFPHKMLQKRYPALLIVSLKQHIRKNLQSAQPDPDLQVFSDPAVMQAFFDDLRKEYRNGFFVHITEERQELTQTAAYIGRYARRPPLSEVRIKDYTGEFVTYEFKDYRNHGSKVLHTLRTVDFIKNLVQHIPPHYFNVIRHYGLLASRVKSLYKSLTDSLLGTLPDSPPAKTKTWRERQTEHRGVDPLRCRICNQTMTFVSIHCLTPITLIKQRFQSTYP